MALITIVVPTIRHTLWERFINSIDDSCGNIDWNLILIGPQNRPSFDDSRISHIESYASPTVCFQQAILEVESPLCLLSSDDSVFYPQSIGLCVSEFFTHAILDQDIMNCRYREGIGFGKHEFPRQYWIAGTYPNVYGQKHVNPTWGLALQTLFSPTLFRLLGGFDCRFEFSNHAHADFAFRVQRIGGKVIQSEHEIANIEHLSHTDEHLPVQQAQEGPDTTLFDTIWNNEENRTLLDINNYKTQPTIWSRRFGKS